MANFIIPPLVDTAGELTISGLKLVTFITRRLTELLKTGVLDDPNNTGYQHERRYYAAVVKKPALLTPAQWIAQETAAAESLWLAYLLTLDPIERERAQIVPATESTARTKEGNTTMLLSEATTDAAPEVETVTFNEALRYARTPEELLLLQRAQRTGERLALVAGHLMEAAQVRRQPTPADMKDIDAFTRWQRGL